MQESVLTGYDQMGGLTFFFLHGCQSVVKDVAVKPFKMLGQEPMLAAMTLYM